MIGQQLTNFHEVWFVDFEFSAPPGEPPSVVCLVARELLSGRYIRAWQDELFNMAGPPYGVSAGSLLIAYYASAEMACHLALGWALPQNVLDLYIEFRNQTNGLPTPCGNGLLGAMAWFGFDAASAAEKDDMRALALRGGPWTDTEKEALLEYCQSDVDALALLWEKMGPITDIPRALLRGWYMKAVAHMENIGVPIDVSIWSALVNDWETLKAALINQVDADFGVYAEGSFKRERFSGWLAQQGIAWPLLPSGQLDLKSETFRDMSLRYPQLAALHQLRETLGKMRLSELQVGSDGRNRCLLSPFRSRTGRNQPSNSRFIFGMPAWMRSLIRPKDGYGLAYLDWCQQEFGIAAKLSEDSAMMEAYASGDPYLSFAIQAGAAPEGATKATHGEVRALFKACVLAVQYGMGADSLAKQIGHPKEKARELLRLHRSTYKAFWAWSDNVEQMAMLRGRLWTVFGWQVLRGTAPNPRFFRNFPMQANGAEMLRLACCLATEKGIRVCAPVHDALLIEAPLESFNYAVEETQSIMKLASEIVLDGFSLRTDVERVTAPDRYRDERGCVMWSLVMGMLGRDA